MHILIFQWDVSESPPDYDSIQKITIGFIFNPDYYTNVLDKGPPADSTEVNTSEINLKS